MRAAVFLALLFLPMALAPVALAAGPADSARASAELTPRVVGVGERVRFTLAVEGPGFVMPRLRPRFDTGDLEIVAGPDVNHGLTLHGGGGWRYSWTWWLEAKSVGAAAVTDVYVLVGDRRIDLPARRIEVVAQPVGGADPPKSHLQAIEELLDRTRDRLSGEPSDGPDDAFLRAVATPPRPYVGQRVVYTVYLYNRTTVRSSGAEQLPTFQGLWARPVDLPPGRRELVDWHGETYQRTPVLRKELYPLSARSHRIEPLRVRLVIDRPDGDRRLFFPTRSPQALVVESNAIDLDVRPLPPGAPGGRDGFAGTVGGMSIAAVLVPEEVPVGRSATLTVTVAGEGHLESLPAPRIRPGGWSGAVEVLGPQSAPPDAPGLAVPEARQRSWQYLLVPRRAGAWELPPVEVPYFDPETERYRVARASLPALRVRPAVAVGAARVAATGARATLPGTADGSWTGGWLGRWASRWHLPPWLLAAGLLAPPVALLVVLVRRRSGSPAAGDGDLPRQRLDAALREDRPRRAAAEVEAAWRELLAGRWGVPETVPPARWPDETLARGADRSACRELRALVDDLHYLRFAPELSETRSLTVELVDRSERLARDLGR